MKSTHGIHSWPSSERPRELMLQKGPGALSDAELIALLLRIGRRGEDAVTFSRTLLKKFGSLGALLHASHGELKKIKGLGPAKIAILSAVVEIARRHHGEEMLGQNMIASAEEVYRLLSASVKGLKKEIFKVLYLDHGNRVLAVEDLFEGTIDAASVYPREVIRRAFDRGATGLIFAHNHPSGRLEPSAQDIDMTVKLFRACEAVDLRPLDHLILTERGYRSLKPYLSDPGTVYAKTALSASG